MNNLRATLEQIGWSERELASRLGAHRNTVNDWTHGRRPMPEAVTSWLETLARFHAETQPPEWRSRS